jgi:hypothetical protein
MYSFLKNPLTFAGITATFLVAVPASHAGLIASDPFATGSTPANGEYTETAVVPQNPTIAGFSGAWGTVYAGSPTVQSGSLSYSSPGYAAPTGGSATTAIDGRVGRMFDGSNPFAVEDNTVYISLLMQLSTSDNYKAFELNSGGGDGTRSFQLGATTSGDFPSGSAFGFRVNNDTAALSASLGALDPDVHLFVVKFSLSSVSLGDSVTVWQDPTIVGSGDPTGGVTFSGFDLVATDRIALANFGSGTAAFDEIRMGTTFQDVTAAVPEPNSIALILGGICVLLFTNRVRRRSSQS